MTAAPATQPIGEVIQHAIGGGWGSEQAEDGTVPVRVIRGADFSDVDRRTAEALPLRFEPLSKVMPRRLQVGDIVLEVSGGTRDRPTGRTVYITQELLRSADADVIPASFCRLVRISRQEAEPQFVYYALQDLYASGGTWEYQNQSTGLSNFQFELFRRKFEIRRIGRGEQRAIAEVLGALDDKIAANTKLTHTAAALLAARFDSLGIDIGTSDSSQSIPLEALIELNPSLPRPLEIEPVYVDMQKLPVTGSSILDWETRPARGGARFQNGDTLMARITPCLENRKTGYVDFLDTGSVALGSTEYIVLRSRPCVPQEFSYFLATSPKISVLHDSLSWSWCLGRFCRGFVGRGGRCGRVGRCERREGGCRRCCRQNSVVSGWLWARLLAAPGRAGAASGVFGCGGQGLCGVSRIWCARWCARR